MTVSVPVSPFDGETLKGKDRNLSLSPSPAAQRGPEKILGQEGVGDDAYTPGMLWAKWLQNSFEAWKFCVL